MVFGALVTLINLLLDLVIGFRLLRAGLRGDHHPELALGIYFLISAFLGTVCQAIVYGGLVDPHLALAEHTSRAVLGVGIFGMAVGGVAICIFTWRTFRRESAWARRIAFAGSCLALGGFAFEALHDGFALSLVPGPGHWIAWLGRTAPMAWVAAESFLYWVMLRRRLHLGLAEPVLVNRFLIWSIWSAANFINLAADVIARVIYTTLAGSTTELVMEVLRPVGIGTMAVTMILGIVSAVTLFLTFFPTAAYRRWVEARAAGQAG